MDSSVFSTIRSKVPCRTSDLFSPICSPVGSQQILCAQFPLNVNRKAFDRIKRMVRLSRNRLGTHRTVRTQDFPDFWVLDRRVAPRRVTPRRAQNRTVQSLFLPLPTLSHATRPLPP